MELVELMDVFKKKSVLTKVISFSVDSKVNSVMGMCKAPSRSSPPEVLSGKVVLERCLEFEMLWQLLENAAYFRFGAS